MSTRKSTSASPAPGKAPQVTGGSKNVVEVEADTLDAARQKLKAHLPQGFSVLSEKVLSDGVPSSLQATADTAEAAFSKIKYQVPGGAAILEKKVLIPPLRETVTVEAFDERSAITRAREQLAHRFRKIKEIKVLKMVAEGRKGFLGLGKKPNRYEIRAVQQAGVEIVYAKKVRISAELGVDVRPLLDMIRSGNRKMQNAIVQDLIKAGDPAVQTLLPLLGDKNAAVRDGVAEALAAIGLPAVAPLGGVLQREKKDARQAAASALVRIATHGPDESTARLAVEKLDSPEALFTVLRSVSSGGGAERPGIRRSAIERVLGLIDARAGKGKRLVEQLESGGASLDEILSEPANVAILRLLSITLRRCQAYRGLIGAFIEQHYYSLGPRLALLLSSHFVATTLEKHYVSHENDVRRLLYLLQPEKPSYSREAMSFDALLDPYEQDRAEYQAAIETYEKTRKGYAALIDQHNALAQQLQSMQTGGHLSPNDLSGLFGQDARLPDWLAQGNSASPWLDAPQTSASPFARLAALKGQIEDLELELMAMKPGLEHLGSRLEAVGGRIESTRNTISAWLDDARDDPQAADAELQRLQAEISGGQAAWAKSSFDLFENGLDFLRQNGLLYEAGAFCDSIGDAFKDTVFPHKYRAIMIRTQADFLKEIYKKSIQMIGDKQAPEYEVQGPTYLILQNNIDDSDVNFLIVGPTVEQIILSSPKKGSNQTSMEIKPGMYTVVCEPRSAHINPLILEGQCLPGRKYPIGISLGRGEGFKAPTSLLGQGVSVNTGLFGVIDIDPLHPLEMLYAGRKYRIRDYLGEGSGGIVYRAVDEATGAASAFKFMTTDLLGGNTQIEIGRREWQAYSSLVEKTSIVGILSYSENMSFFQQNREQVKKKPVAAYQMEYADCGSLKTYLESRVESALHVREVVEILRGLCLGLESIHRSSLVHRDLRPENVLVFQNPPRYRICDFTLTREKLASITRQLTGVFGVQRRGPLPMDDFMERRTVSTLQSFQRVIGSSTFYAAPEEHAGLGNFDARSDIYSMGGILYWLLVGFDPFELLLRQHNRALYEAYRAALDCKVLQLDFKRRQELFGDWMKLQADLRSTNLALKQAYSMDIDPGEINCTGVNEAAFALFRQFLLKTIQPDPAQRFQSTPEMSAAVREIESVV